MGKWLLLLLLLLVSLSITGCGVPGVDYPFDETAFWDPDVPDYADDGDPYSLRMLGSGTVIDHLRQLQTTSAVTNFATQIQNQLLNLKKLGTKLPGVDERFTQLQSSDQKTEGILKSANWQDVFPDTLKLESGQYTTTMQDTETLLKANSRTYQDALRQATIGIQTDYVQAMINQVSLQNESIVGNNQGKQNTNQGYAIKVIQQTTFNQSNAFMLSTILNAAEMSEQANAEAFQNAKSISIGVADPYNPKPDEPEREKGMGFIRF